MLRATSVIRTPHSAPGACADTVTLDAEGRYRRRVAIKGDSGALFLLDLAQAAFLNDGDALALEDGRHLRVRAAPEMLYEVHAQDRLSLLRLAWHLGNRHTPTELTDSALYLSADHVLADMLRGLGAHVHEVVRPFNPEGGAYGDHGAAHGAGHSHGSHSHGSHAHGSHSHSHD
jgi:urease accessory protein